VVGSTHKKTEQKPQDLLVKNFFETYFISLNRGLLVDPHYSSQFHQHLMSSFCAKKFI